MTSSTSRAEPGSFNHPLLAVTTSNNCSSLAYHSTNNANNVDDSYTDHSDADLIGEECRPGPINTLLDARSQALFAVLQDHTYAIQPHPSVSAPEPQLSGMPTQQQQSHKQQLRSIPSSLQQRHEAVAQSVRSFTELANFQNHPPVGGSHVLSTTSAAGSGSSQLMYTTSGSLPQPPSLQQQQPHPVQFQSVAGLTTSTSTVDGSVIVQKTSLAGGGFNLEYHKQSTGKCIFILLSLNNEKPLDKTK